VRTAMCFAFSWLEKSLHSRHCPNRPGFLGQRAPCHVGGGPAADMHSCMRVFIYTKCCYVHTYKKWRVVWPRGLASATPAVAGRSAVALQGCLAQVKMARQDAAAKRAISPFDAESKQGILFIAWFVYSQIDKHHNHPRLPYFRSLALVVRPPHIVLRCHICTSY
jgi:hypothetical protein